MKKEKWSKRHSSGFRKWLITVLLAISVLMTGYSVLKETGDVLLDQAKAWMEEGIDGARDEAGDDGDVASDKKCGGTSAAETPERRRLVLSRSTRREFSDPAIDGVRSAVNGSGQLCRPGVYAIYEDPFAPKGVE